MFKGEWILDLMNQDFLKIIQKDNKKYLLAHKYPILEDSNDSDSISNYEKLNPNFISNKSHSIIDGNKNNSSIEMNNNNITILLQSQ